jgi:hypothetical protein
MTDHSNSPVKKFSLRKIKMDDIRLDDSNDILPKENISPKRKSILGHLARKISDNEAIIYMNN